MDNPQRFPFVTAKSEFGEASLQPQIPLTLTLHDNSVDTFGLLDTGSMVNVLPWSLGLDLGATWAEQTNSLNLTGNLARFEARVLMVSATIGKFDPVRLAFAWTRATNVPLLLGQVNFFMEFNTCFYRSQLTFEVSKNS